MACGFPHVTRTRHPSRSRHRALRHQHPICPSKTPRPVSRLWRSGHDKVTSPDRLCRWLPRVVNPQPALSDRSRPLVTGVGAAGRFGGRAELPRGGRT
ncbi:hypothetical protein [Azospirillum melinis]